MLQYYRDGLNLRKAIENEPSGLTGNDTPLVSARKFLTAIIDSLHKRFTDEPGILGSMTVFNLSMFPADEEDLESKYCQYNCCSDFFFIELLPFPFGV